MKPTALLVYLLPAIVFAQVSSNSSDSYLYGYDIGNGYSGGFGSAYSYQTDGQTANATGTTLLPGYNITLPPHDFNTTYANYSLSINVTEVWANFTDHQSSSDVYTNTYIDLTPPPSVGYESNATIGGWNTCIVVLTNLTMNATKAGQNDTGKCYETFGFDCAQNLTRAMEEAWSKANFQNATAENVCENIVIPAVPPQCAGLFTLSNAQNTTPPSTFMIGRPTLACVLLLSMSICFVAVSLALLLWINQLDFVSIWQRCFGVPRLRRAAHVLKTADINAATQPSDYFPLLYVGTPQHKASDTSYYENATSRIWPILLMQSPRNESLDSVTSLNCLKTKNATQGSIALTGSSSSGVVPTAPGVLVWGMTGAAIMLAGLF